MKIQFEKNQEYQLQAIQAVIDTLEGQALGGNAFALVQEIGSLAFTEHGVGNQLTISTEQILENLQIVQTANHLAPSDELKLIQYKTEEGETTSPMFGRAAFGNFSIDMETGTGKTYVYIRTIYELNKVYGFKKFVIVVPSIAIKEGVVKNLQITFDHFQELYQNEPVRFEVYDSKKLNSLSNFARSNTVQILVINIDAFAKDQNIINQVRETGVKPIEYLQGTNPIVIVDEPQNMETDIRKRAIANLNPLFTLRYSATHTNAYNLIYKLDPVKAYDLGLVKQIEVDSVVADNENGGAFMSLDGFKLAKRSLGVVLTILVNQSSGSSPREVVKKRVTAKNGDNLYQLSGQVEAYKNGYVINTIDSEEQYIEFSSGNTLYQGQPQGGLNEEVQREMILATIENHLRKEKELNPLGIKVLSVFFIDKVANYRVYDSSGNPQPGKFASWFEEALNATMQKPAYRNLYTHEVASMHDGYFSQDKGKFRDSKEGKGNKADDEAYQLIMRKKEELLDIDTPLRFIFSHSALREGWDNPNVFQICTLNETKSETKKRQEIGRGLRLCVDKNGVRNREREINRLTVIANESYETFARALQSEIEQDAGVNFAGRIKNARTRQKVELKKGWNLDPHFLDLWNRIKYKTDYQVDYTTADLIRNASKAVKAMPAVPMPQIQRVKTLTVFDRDAAGQLIGVGGEVKSSKERTVTNTFELPDFVGYIQSKTELTRDTISQIILNSGRLKEVFNNPQLFMDSVVRVIKAEFDALKINGIKYEKVVGGNSAQQSYEMQLFEGREVESYLDNLIAVKKQEKTLFNYILIDSLSTPEQTFAKECESRDDILFYIKLPAWFVIKTPIGGYNPDWALIKQEEGEQKKIYFVAETKDPKAVKNRDLLRESERMKIHCGEQHFAEFDDVAFAPVGGVSDIPG